MHFLGPEMHLFCIEKAGSAILWEVYKKQEGNTSAAAMLLILCNFAAQNFVCLMQIQVMKSKLHRVTVTEADLNYIGSVTIDEDLMDAANFIEHEKVQIVNINNGERLETYIIKGVRGSGKICLNGPAARKVSPGDLVIIISYGLMDFEEAKSFKPTVIFPKEGNKL